MILINTAARSIWVRGYLAACLCLISLVSAPIAAAVEQVIYYHFDALGSPVAASDATGNYYLWKETYQPYGERIQKQPNSASNNRWYTGKPQDEETGLSYFGARYYDPVVGRFMGVDPKEFSEDNPRSFNRYNYANNNPYKYIDPDGQVPILVPIIVPAVIGVGTFIYELYNPPAINPAYPDAIYPSMGPGEVLGGGITATGRTGILAGERIIAERFARNATGVTDILKPGGQFIGKAGSSATIRELSGGVDEARRMFEKLSQGGKLIDNPRYPGKLVELPGGGRVGLRESSTSGPPTIDIHDVPGLPDRVKLKF